jgi:hypothetical protein
MAINPEKMAIILEIISFFLITIDLFGRTRIEKLQGRFENSLSSFKDKDLKEIYYKFYSLGKDNDFLNAFTLILFISWIVCGYAAYSLTPDWTHWRLLIPIVIVFFAGIAATFILIGLGSLIVRLSEVIIDGMFHLILLLFNKLKLEGAMLIIGAGIFLVSKIISLICISSK